ADGGTPTAAQCETDEEQDPQATVRLGVSIVAPTRAASPTATSPVVLQSDDSGSTVGTRWKRLALPIGALLLLGVALALRWSVRVPVSEAPAAEPRATPSPPVPLESAPSREVSVTT